MLSTYMCLKKTSSLSQKPIPLSLIQLFPGSHGKSWMWWHAPAVPSLTLQSRQEWRQNNQRGVQANQPGASAQPQNPDTASTERKVTSHSQMFSWLPQGVVHTCPHSLSHANTNKMKPAGRWGGRFTGGAERRTAGKAAWRQASKPTTQLILFLIFLYFKKKMRSIMNLPLGISLTTFQIQLLVCTILIFRIVFNMTLIQVI